MSSPAGTEQVRRLTLAAISAPTADNCQPWSFDWDGERLAIHHDDARAKNVINHRGGLSLLSLGCVLEAIDIASGAEGLVPSFDIQPRPESPAPWAKVRFRAAPAVTDPLHAAIELRATDRRAYQGGSLPADLVRAIEADASGSPDCGVYLVRELSGELMDYLSSADAYTWYHEDAYRDFLVWVRFSAGEVEASGDGVPWCSLGLDLPRLPAAHISRSRFAQRAIERLGLSAATRLWLRRLFASSSALVCFTVREASTSALVSAGRLAYRAWLRLNQAGFGVQPVTTSALFVYQQASADLPPTVKPEFVDLFRRGRGLLGRALGHPEAELPVWLLRTGRSTPLPAHQRAQRLPLDRVFITS